MKTINEKSYNRLDAGERLPLKRNLLGHTREDVAERIGRSTKYYADIERRTCGMSIETLMALSTALDMPMEYIIYGSEEESFRKQQHTDETLAILSMLDSSSKRNRKYAVNLLETLLAACDFRTDMVGHSPFMEQPADEGVGGYRWQ